MTMTQIVRTVDGTPVPTAEKVELHGNPRAVTNVNENSTFLVVGQSLLPKDSTVHIAPLSKCVICQHNRQRSNYKD